jgi:riboflavin synthase
MFTGIIEELGTVKFLDKSDSVAKLQILAPKIGPGSKRGQSVSVNGVCLTIVAIEKDILTFETMPQTFKGTNLGTLKQADKVNLERALKVEGRLDGHFVTGHIDDTGMIKCSQKKGKDAVIEIESSEQILRYVALKGSVALDGVSLTVSALNREAFAVNLIPYTLKNSPLGLKQEGNLVNIECDILAKYISKFLATNRQTNLSKINSSFLQRHGFI